MLFAYIDYLRSQSVEVRRRLVWWYTSACTFAVVLVWLGVVLLGGGSQYSFGTTVTDEPPRDTTTQRASARERLNALRAEVGYPPLPTLASSTGVRTAPSTNATQAPMDPEAYAQWQNTYFSEQETSPGATTTFSSSTPTAGGTTSLNTYE